jgi:hypothetical protein
VLPWPFLALPRHMQATVLSVDVAAAAFVIVSTS